MEPQGISGKRPFRFQAFWVNEVECLQLVEQCWAKPVGGDVTGRWMSRINDCRTQLQRWSRRKFKLRQQDIEQLTSQLGELQLNWGDHEEEINIKSRLLDQLLAQEESVWKQRSRIKWLQDGDANTKFFHQSTMQRRRRNQVMKLKMEDGRWEEKPQRIKQLVDDYFLHLFTSIGSRSWGSVLEHVPSSVSDSMNNVLLAPISDAEILDATMRMDGLKAPGPDGFPGVFYQNFWEPIRRKVHDLVRLLDSEEVYLGNINATNIVLIPKVPHPEEVSQFRPISLCNFSYKILAKVLANRLKPLLPDLISPMQNAFVGGRQIQDNIGVAHEIFHFLKLRKARSRFEMGIKLDMEKAYDRVEWDFLDAVMEKMGFHSRWRKLVMGCVTSVSFSILLNGQPGCKFAPSRGLRQGDPLSPYLFLFVSDVFSRMIHGVVNRQVLAGVKMNVQSPVISHIFFADDSLLFLKANRQNCCSLVQLIDEYCAASGQAVNFQKSVVFFSSNTPLELSKELGHILHMKVAADLGTYLGVPALWGRSKRQGLAFIKGRVLKKINGWTFNTLSLAGKEVLIKAVVQAIPAYPMSVFKFPKAVCHDLDSLIAEFWWGSVGDHRKTHWVSKHTLGLSKKDGGLGFRNFGDFNDALLAKQCWRLIHNPDSLWAKVLKAKYFPNCSFLDAQKGSRASWGWNSLLVGRDILLQGAHWQILNGRSVRVWVDRWLPSLPLGHPMPGRVSVTRDTRVASLLSSSPRLWNIEFLQPFLSVEERSAILATPLGDDLLPDRLVWPHTGTGMYSVRSGYLWARSSRQQAMPSRASSSSTPTSQIWTLIWNLKTPPKVRHFMWRLAHGALATFEKMYVRKLASTPLCPICQKQEESLEHLFLMCSWVEPIWFGGMLNLRIDRSSISSWLNWFLSVASCRYGSKEERWEILSYIAVSCWHIWTARCKFLFQQVNLNPYQVLMAIRTARGKFLEAKGASAIMSSDALPMIGQEVR
ncbi:hypothetical protein ACFXTI_005579 [Malus domestica]